VRKGIYNAKGHRADLEGCSMLESSPWQEHRGEIQIPTKQYAALVAGAMTTLQELEKLAHAARRVLCECDAITHDTVEKLRQDLMFTNAKVQVQMEATMDRSTDASGTKWDEKGYARGVAPSLEILATPQAIVNLIQAAVDRGAKSAKLLYELMIAEIEVAVARWYVSANAMLTTSVPPA
jgi:hypothetical protein